MTDENKKVWDRVMTLGKQCNRGMANKINKDDVTTIIATMEYFGASMVWMRQTYFDLTIPKFKVYDWLAMCIMSRANDSEFNTNALKVLCYSFIKSHGNERDFVDDLRCSDYECDTKWEQVEVRSK